MIYFETERLIFRDWYDADIKDFVEMNQNPYVMKYFPKLMSEDDTLNMYQRIQDEFKEKNFGLFAVEHKQHEDFIGFIGLHEATFEETFTPCIEIGWRLKKAYWNQGLATEGAQACLDYAVSELKLDKIYSFTAAINTPSQRVMQKIGMNFEKHFDHPSVDDGSDLKRHVLYVYEK